jgi:hypothetical protein
LCMTTLYNSWRTLGRGGLGNGGATANSGARPATCGPGKRCCVEGGGDGDMAQAANPPTKLASNSPAGKRVRRFGRAARDEGWITVFALV